DQAAGIAGRAEEQRGTGIGTLDRKVEVIVVGKGVGAVDADFAAVETVTRVKRRKLDIGAAGRRDLHGFGIDRFTVQEQGDFASSSFGAIAGNRYQYAGFLGIEDAARRIGVFDGEVRHHAIGIGVK